MRREASRRSGNSQGTGNTKCCEVTSQDSWPRLEALIKASRRKLRPEGLGGTRKVLDFPGGSDSKESPCNEGDLGSIPGLGRSPGDGHGFPVFLPEEPPWTEEPNSPWGHKVSDTTEGLSTAPEHPTTASKHHLRCTSP